MSEERATYEVITSEKRIEEYRAIGSAVFEIYSDGTMKCLTVYNVGTTDADMTAACSSATQYATALNNWMAF